MGGLQSEKPPCEEISSPTGGVDTELMSKHSLFLSYDVAVQSH